MAVLDQKDREPSDKQESQGGKTKEKKSRELWRKMSGRGGVERTSRSEIAKGIEKAREEERDEFGD